MTEQETGPEQETGSEHVDASASEVVPEDVVSTARGDDVTEESREEPEVEEASASTASPSAEGAAHARDSVPVSTDGLRARRVLASGALEGEVTLDAHIFGAEPSIPLLHQVVVAEEANARRGTHSAKTRAEVAGGGAKPYRQKGTGNARQGSTRAPQFTGGGVVHGPRPRSYHQDTPKKMVRAALRQALSDRARHERVFVLAGEFGQPSTKAARRVLEVADLVAEHVALVAAPHEEDVVLSFRNLPQIVVTHPGSLLTGTVLASDAVLVTEAGLAGLGERLGPKER